MEETLLISKENAPIGQRQTLKKIDVCKYAKKNYKEFLFSCSEDGKFFSKVESKVSLIVLMQLILV